jgi:hypothetical protein
VFPYDRQPALLSQHRHQHSAHWGSGWTAQFLLGWSDFTIQLASPPPPASQSRNGRRIPQPLVASGDFVLRTPHIHDMTSAPQRDGVPSIRRRNYNATAFLANALATPAPDGLAEWQHQRSLTLEMKVAMMGPCAASVVT